MKNKSVYLCVLVILSVALWCSISYIKNRKDKSIKQSENTVNEKVKGQQFLINVNKMPAKQKAKTETIDQASISNQIQSFIEDVNLAKASQIEYEELENADQLNIILKKSSIDWNEEEWQIIEKHLASLKNVDDELMKTIKKDMQALCNYAYVGNKAKLLACMENWIRIAIDTEASKLGNEVLHNVCIIQLAANGHKEALKTSEIFFERVKENIPENRGYQISAIESMTFALSTMGDFNRADQVFEEWFKTSENARPDQIYILMVTRMMNCMVATAPASRREKMKEYRDEILKDPRFTEEQKKLVKRF